MDPLDLRRGRLLPAVVLLSILQAPAPRVSTATEIWIGSNVGARDLDRLALDAAAWPTLRALTTVFTFYGQVITATDRSDCAACEGNLFRALNDRGVFREIHDRGMRINVETGAVKDWDCDAAQNIDVAVRILDRFRSIGVPISHLSMDEPFMAGAVWCGQTPAYTAERVANYMAVVGRHWRRTFREAPVSIGLVEPYPRHDMAAIIQFVKMLIARGQRPSYFHLDVNKREIPARGFDEQKVRADFQMLARFLERERIPWGTFFASLAGDNPEDYRTDFLDTAASIHRWYGAPRHLVFQSWERTLEDGVAVNRRPHNTPEQDAYSLTGLANDALRILGVK